MDLRSEKNLDQRLDSVLIHHNAIRKGLGKKIFEKDQLKSDLLKIAPKILEFSQPVWLKIDQFKKQKKKILFEGAQGILLDVDHGTYPYVTSSNPVSGGACIGAGVGPTLIDRVIGVAKAYTTRVGEGPFPTELTNSKGEYLREKGAEFGTTTNRPRRCGWLDLVVLRYAIRLNGITEICFTKLDVLDGLETIKVCKGYETDNGFVEQFPLDQDVFLNCKPVYDELPGWEEDISQLSQFDQLPENAKKYIH